MKKVLGAFLLLGVSAFARTLTLEEAIELSLTNSKDIQIASKNKEIGGLNLARAFKYALPTLAYEGVYTRYEHGTRKVYDEFISEAGKVDSKDGYSNKLVVTYPLFQGGAVVGGVKGAKAQRNILDYSFLKEKSNVRINTITLYTNVLKYEKNLEALRYSEKELESRYKLQSEKLKSRLIVKADLLKTEYSLLQIKSEIVRVKTLIKTEKQRLAIELGLNNINEDLTLASLNIPGNLSQSMNLDQDMVTAKTESLNALIALNKVEYSEAEKLVALSDNLPKVTAFASYGGTERLHFDDTLSDEEWRGGVRVDWELFSFGSGVDAYNVAKKNYEIEKLNNSSTQDDIEINLLTAHSEVIRLEQLRRATKSSLDATAENFRIDKRRYEEGLISVQDYLNSESQFRSAQMEYNSSEANYLVAFEKYRSMII